MFLLYEGVHSGSVLGEIIVEGGHSFGEADRFSSGCSDGDGLVADLPPCDLGDSSAGQRSASVDAEINDPQEPGESVEGGGAFGSHLLTGGDEHAPAGAFAVVIARVSQVCGFQGKRGCCDSAGIEGVGLADSAVRARVHPGCFGDLVAGLAGCLRELSTVGADSLDDPEDVQIRAGAPRGPVECALKTRLSGRELGRVDQFSQRCGEDRQTMRLRVGVDADDKGMGMRDDSQGDRGSFLVSGNRDRSLRPAPDREGVTPGQLVTGHYRTGSGNLLIKSPSGPRRRRPPAQRGHVRNEATPQEDIAGMSHTSGGAADTILAASPRPAESRLT